MAGPIPARGEDSEGNNTLNWTASRSPHARGGFRPVYPGGLVRWGRAAPFELAELTKVIPADWRRPRIVRSEVGRDCIIFRSLMGRAGPDREGDLDARAATLNLQFDVPLDHPELAGIVSSVGRYRAAWPARRHCPTRPARAMRATARGRRTMQANDKSRQGGRFLSQRPQATPRRRRPARSPA